MKTWDNLQTETDIVALDTDYQNALARRKQFEIELATLEQSPPSSGHLERLTIERERIAVAVTLGEATPADLEAIDNETETATLEYTSATNGHNETIRLKREGLQVLQDREREALQVSKERHRTELRAATEEAWKSFDRQLGATLVELERVMTLHKTAIANGLCENAYDYGRHGDPPYLYLNFRRYLDRLKNSGLLEKSATLQGDSSPQDVLAFQAQRY